MLSRCTLLLPALLAPLAAQNTGLLSTAGIDAFVEVPYDAALVPSSGMTIEAWITFDDSTMPTGLAYYPTIVRQNVARNSESYLLRVNSGSTNNLSILFLVRDQTGAVHTVTGTFMPGQLQSFTHIAATYGPTGMSLFLNGQQLASTPGTMLPVADNGGTLRIGNGDTTYAGAESWNGEIDEVRVWPFARSATEIQASINDELSGIPGGVLTFGLNNSTNDSSAGLMGNAVGTLVFQSNSLALTPRAGVAQAIGQSWSSCAAIGNTIGSVPTVGNAAFRVVGTHGAPSSAGAIVVGVTANAMPIQILGIGVYLLAPIASAGLPTDSFGTASAPLPIPSDTSLAGFPLCTQWAFADATCGTFGLTASPALCFTVQ